MPSGERRIDPSLAADPFGPLFYDSNGNFAAQIMKRDRDASTPEIDQQAAPNTRRAEGGYHTHFDTYSVDDTEGTVTRGLVGVLQSCAPCGGDVSGSRLGGGTPATAERAFPCEMALV